MLSRLPAEALRSVNANARTVLLRVTPTPATLTERRAILGVLKKHAGVEVFKRLHVRQPVQFLACVARL